MEHGKQMERGEQTENYGERAAALFCKGHNCAQSVFAAFQDIMGLDEQLALRMMASFGGGMGRLREVCGALTGLFAAIGVLYGYTGTDDQEAKARHYQMVQDFAGCFKEEFGSIICRDLLKLQEEISDPMPEPRTESYYQKRSCAEYVRYSAAMLEVYIKK